MRVRVTGMSHDGRAIAKTDQGVVFFSGALLGEEVEINIIGKEKKILLGELVQIYQANEGRIRPRCEVFDLCGGCTYQMAEEGLQKRLKIDTINNALLRIGKLDSKVSHIEMMEEPWRYRNKGLFHVDYKGGMAKIGFYEKKSHALVPAKKCLLFSKPVNQLIEALEEGLTHYGLAYHIDKVLIRESFASGDLMLVFISKEGKFRGDKLLKDLLVTFPQIKSVYFNINHNHKLTFGKRFDHLFGEKRLEDKVLNKRFLLSPEAFFQINGRQTNVLYKTVQAMLPKKSGVIYDIYSGIGSIGISIAEKDSVLIGVERNHQAVLDARDNVKLNQLTHAKYYQANAEKWIQEINFKENDVIIIDPPRKGVDSTLIDVLVDSEVKNIIYISCDPATLARDLASFTKSNYQIKKVVAVDMFPQTAHVETVVLMMRVAPAK